MTSLSYRFEDHRIEKITKNIKQLTKDIVHNNKEGEAIAFLTYMRVEL